MNQLNGTAIVKPSEETALVAKAKDLQRRGSSTSWELADTYSELSERGWTQQRIAEECGANRSTVCKFIACAKKCSVLNNRPPFWEAFAEANGEKPKSDPHVSHNSGLNEWYTPPEYIDAAREVLGTIDLDPATSSLAQNIVKAKKIYTAKDDGLSHIWEGRVWLNPPYGSDLIGQFVEKLCVAVESGEVPEAIMLVNNATETTWFQRASKSCSGICYHAGRIKFIDEYGEPSRSPLQGQAFLYFGDEPDRFFAAFKNYGFCTRVYRDI